MLGTKRERERETFGTVLLSAKAAVTLPINIVETLARHKNTSLCAVSWEKIHNVDVRHQ